jgi:hypothetical protein
MKGTFWKNQPVIPEKNTKEYDYIGIIPSYINSKDYNIFSLTPEYIIDVLDFINNNYIDGYCFDLDYFQRKLKINNSYHYVLICDSKICGFIYSQPIIINNKEGHYVDLMTVSRNHRGKGLANILISAITNFSGKSQFFIHKKDREPLPFYYFYKTRHYSADINTLYNKYKIQNLNYEEVIEEYQVSQAYNIYRDTVLKMDCTVLIEKNIFYSSKSVRSYIFDNNALVSFTIFKFRYRFHTIRLAELFFISNTFNLNSYKQLVSILKLLNIDYIVVVPYLFFIHQIIEDKYKESLELFLHSYNLFIPTINSFILPIF